MSYFAIPGLMTPSSPRFEASGRDYAAQDVLTSAAEHLTDPIYLGDAWPGIPTIRINVNGAPLPADVASARMIFFSAEHGPECPAQVLESPTDILIVSADTWELTVPAIVLELGRGKWYFRLATLSEDGPSSSRTWLVGHLLIL